MDCAGIRKVKKEEGKPDHLMPCRALGDPSTSSFKLQPPVLFVVHDTVTHPWLGRFQFPDDSFTEGPLPFLSSEPSNGRCSKATGHALAPFYSHPHCTVRRAHRSPQVSSSAANSNGQI